MSKGFNVDLKGLKIKSDEIQKILKQYKKLKKYQKSGVFAVKTMDGTENIISKMVEEAKDIDL